LLRLTSLGRRWRPPAIGIFVIVLLLLGLDTAAWLFACMRLEDGVRTGAVAAEAEGWTMRAGPSAWAGWPIAAEVRFPTVTIRGSQSVFPPGLAWSAERVRLRVGLTHPTILAVIAEGAQTIAAKGVPAVPFRTELSRAAIDLNGRDPARVRIARLEAALPAGSLRIGAAELQLPPDGLTADLTDITVPGGGGHELSPAIGSFRLQAHATRPFPAAPIAAESARAWRAAGGSIEVSNAALIWGPLAASGRVSIGLDERLQPGADGTIAATGLSDFLDALVGTEALARPAAVATKAVVAILSAPAEGGPVSLPLAFHDGVLSIARVPLLRLPPLVWE
jgi:hypothetical protein